MNVKTSALAIVSALTLLAFTGCKEEVDLAAQHRNKGYALAKQAKYSEALTEYDESLKVDPKQDKLWEQKAFALIQVGRKDEAVAALEKTLDLRPDPKEKSKLLKSIAGMYLQSGTPDKSEKYFLDALKLDPKDEEALTWLGEYHSQQGGARANDAPAQPEHLEKAIAYYDQVLTLNPISLTAVANKRIALTKYMNHELGLKQVAENEIHLAGKKNPTLVADATARAAAAQTKMDELKTLLDATTAKLSEVLKAQKAQKK